MGRIVALDANLMVAADTRRLLCAMQELTGGKVYVTPRVWRETWEVSADTNLHAALQEAVHHPARKDAVHRRAAHFTQAWRRWMVGEKQQSDSAWMYVPAHKNPLEATVLYYDIMRSRCLKDGPKKADDAHMVAEAILSGAHVLASRDTRSIRHDILNIWARGRKATGDPLFSRVPHDFIVTPDGAAHLACQDIPNMSIGEAGLRWAVAACMPNRDDGPGAVDAIIRNFLGHVDAQMPVLAELSKEFLAEMQEMGPQWHAEVRSYPLAARKRATEDRRIALVRTENPEPSP